ncbi:hypothetical protein [Herbiconiux sp. A18JL235]|uniref:Cellulose biosynthesis protein BcsF n=1 Tax=Herbiconiux sp. A18JL235 TaxID=3152363 RepID=A0AB39BG71_9MICO
MTTAHLLIVLALGLPFAGLLCEVLRPVGPRAARSFRRMLARLRPSARLTGAAVPSTRATPSDHRALVDA